MEPWRVTNEEGALLPDWRGSRVVFDTRLRASGGNGSAAESAYT